MTAITNLWSRLQAHPKRLKRCQKDAFLTVAEHYLTEWGYAVSRHQSKNIVNCVNLQTECEQPSYLFLAHYDTPTMMPFWLSGMFKLFGHTRQIILTLVLIVLIVVLGTLEATWAHLLYWVLIGSFLMLLIPNPNNANDNTSGVLGVLELARRLADDPELKSRVKFALVDNEEWGLLGSSVLRQHLRGQGVRLSGMRIISLDCIGAGTYPMVIQNGKSDFAGDLHNILAAERPQSLHRNLGIVPMSDNYSFRDLGAVNISFFNKALIPGGYVIDHVHSYKDAEIDVENVAWVASALEQFVRDDVIAGENHSDIANRG